MFLLSDVVRKVGGYDEQFGLGSGSFEGGEETDLALKIFGAGKHILFTPDVRIWHPQDRHDLHMPEKQWGYEEAWGALFRKWSRPGRIGPSILVSAAWFIARSYLAAAFHILRGDWRVARQYLRKNAARRAGWLKYRRTEDASAAKGLAAN